MRRGGGGRKQFVFAILDWSNSLNSNQRRLQYIATGGVIKTGSTLTNKMFETYFNVNS